jgi:hypothetical protein
MGFLADHHRKAVANRVNDAAGGTAKALLIGGQLHGSLTDRTHQQIE